MLLFYVFYYVLASILLFQGLHFASEITAPLGTLPEEVGQAPTPSLRWGSFLVAYGTLSLVIGLLSHQYEYFGSALRPIAAIGVLAVSVFGLWIIFKGRSVVYLAEPPGDQSDHGHH